MIQSQGYRPEELVWLAWRRKWLLATPLVACAALAAGVSSLLPNRYRSETLILVVPQRIPESYVKSTVTTRIEDRLQSITQQILSRTRLERIIGDFGLYAEQRKTRIMEDIVAQMRDEIDVDLVKGDSFRVSYISDNPVTAKRVTERLASLFIEENLRDRELLAEGTNQFLESQLEEARGRLLEKERAIADYKLRHAPELPEQRPANLQVLQNTQLQIQALVESVNRDRDRRLALVRAIEDASLAQEETPAPAGGADPGRSALDADAAALSLTAAQQLELARKTLRALQLKFTPEHPDVIRQKRLVQALEEKVAAEALELPLSPVSSDVRSPSPAATARQKRLRELQRELAGLDAQIAAKEANERGLRQTVEVYTARVEAVPTRETEMIELQRDYATIQSMYTALLTKKEESRIAADLERRQIGEQFKVLDPARVPGKPFSPKRLQFVLIGAALGLGLGIGLAALLEYRDTTFKTEQDVTVCLALPTLALIPAMQQTADPARRRRLVLWLTGAVVLALSGAAGAAWLLTGG